MPPFLPRELVEMTLADPVLDYDKVTLARCCLLSKAHLHPFRRRLYRSLVIRLCETEDRLLDFELEPWQMVYDDATEQVLSKLRRHAHLRPLVQEIRMEVCSAGSMPAAVGTFTTTDAALATALHCCPYANSVFLPEDFDGQVTCRPMLEGMFRRPYQRVELLEDIALAWAFIHRHQDTLQEVSFGRFFEGIIPPSITASNGYGNLRLKNLRIPTLCTDAPSALMRRDALQTLLIPSRLSLTTLEITFDTRIFPDLADLPSLRHLLLHFEPTLLAASAAPAAVARSPNLQSLTVNGVHWMEPSELDSLFSPTKDGLAHHLPLSVTSLSLWSDTPKLDHLRNFLRFLPANSSLRHFEYPSPHWNERDIYEETDKEFTAKGIIMRRDGFCLLFPSSYQAEISFARKGQHSSSGSSSLHGDHGDLLTFGNSSQKRARLPDSSSTFLLFPNASFRSNCFKTSVASSQTPRQSQLALSNTAQALPVSQAHLLRPHQLTSSRLLPLPLLRTSSPSRHSPSTPSISLSFLSDMPKPLPRELMEQIFGEPVLLRSTLARCCRLSKGWVEFFRNRLYSTCVFDLYDSEADAYTPHLEHQVTQETLQLLTALSASPSVARHVKTVRFTHEWEEGCGVNMTPLTLFASILRLCPCIESLGFPLYDAADCYPFLTNQCSKTGRRFSRIDLNRPTDEMWALLDIVQDGLIHLEFGNIREGGWSAYKAPSAFLPALHLQSLSLATWTSSRLLNGKYQRDTFDTLVRHSHQTLRSLEISFSPEVDVDLSPFTELRHLKLAVSSLTATSHRPFRALLHSAMRLTTLDMEEGYLLSTEAASLVGTSYEGGLAASLAPTLIHLILPTGFLTSHLLTFLQHLPLSHPLRFLKFQRKRHGPNERMKARRGLPLPPEEDYSQVEEVCRERGIELKMT